MIGKAAWIAVAVGFVQVTAPGAPTNLRLVDGSSNCPAGQVGSFPNCFPVPPAPVAAGKQWRVTYSEEFNGTALDPSKLTPCFDWNFGACTAARGQRVRISVSVRVRLCRITHEVSRHT